MTITSTITKKVLLNENPKLFKIIPNKKTLSDAPKK
jgi:hypothetical protein